ncbi:MAG: ornithine cyclodeaminase family protein [Actinobacteria bacterium]|nr:ornithine cyclodeaminase family protein [Actinomycetota bacterium]
MENQRQVFKNFYLDEAVMGPRAILSQGENAQFSYIARASKDGPTIVKFGTVVPSNAARDISVVQTTVSVIDAITGSVKLFLDGEAVTKWRTVCASMAAAKELANPVKKIAVIGMGHQGSAHALAAKHIFEPEKIIGIDKYIKTSESGIDLTQEIEAAYGCDLIFICTNSRLEVSVEALSKADKVFGDDAKTISEQSGSVVHTLINSERTWDQPQSIGGVYAKKLTGRENTEQVIYYFSVGLGIQDAALAEFILTNGKF